MPNIMEWEAPMLEILDLSNTKSGHIAFIFEDVLPSSTYFNIS